MDKAAEARSIAYASGNLGKSLLWSSADLTLLFILIELMAVPPRLAGTWMLIALGGDIIVDLFAGKANAQARQQGITYRLLLLIVAPLCALSFAGLFALSSSQSPNFTFFILLLFAFRIFYGFVDIPHNAMMPGIASDSRTRTRVAGYRFFFSTVGTLLVATFLAPAVANAAIGSDTSKIAYFGSGFAILSVVTLWLAAFTDRGSPLAATRIGYAPFLPTFSRDYVRLLSVAIIIGFGLGMFARTMLFFATYVLDRPSDASTILMCLVGGQFVGVPAWVVIAQRTEIRTALALAMLVATPAIAVFALSDGIAALIAAGCAGAALAGAFQLPWALLSNIIDIDHARSGARRESQAMAIFLVVLKLGAGASSLVSGWALSAAGRGTSSEPATSLSEVIYWLVIGIPIIAGMAGAAIAMSIRTTHDDHASLRRSGAGGRH